MSCIRLLLHIKRYGKNKQCLCNLAIINIIYLYDVGFLKLG